jgi:hypothetical protein
MSFNEIPEFFHPEIRQLIDFALEDAWQELRKGGLADGASMLAEKGQLSRTIVALAAIGETDPVKMKRFALQAASRVHERRNRSTPRQDVSAGKGGSLVFAQGVRV